MPPETYATELQRAYATVKDHRDALQAENERLTRKLAIAEGVQDNLEVANERYRAALEEIAEGCGHARCHAYPWIRTARKALVIE